MARSLRRRRQHHISFSERYLDTLRSRQADAGLPLREISLTFMPIAKNVRNLGTALREATQRGQRLIIRHGNELEEEQLRRDLDADWHPWLWSRTTDPTDEAPIDPAGQHNRTSTLWCRYFRGLPAQRGTEADRGDPTETPDGGPRPRRPSRWQGGVLEAGLCTAEAFELNDATLETIHGWKQSMTWPEGQRVLGVHVRRGDASSIDLQRQTRPSKTLDEYMAAADRICALYDIETLYLSTESQEEIDRASALRPKLNILSLHHDRSIFPSIEADSKFIEIVALENPDVVKPLLMSALADLYFLQQSHAFIGTFNSEFSVLAYLLQVGHHRSITPFHDLTGHMNAESSQRRLSFLIDT